MFGVKTGGGRGGDSGSRTEELVGGCSGGEVVFAGGAVLVHPTSPTVFELSVWLGDGRGCVCCSPILLPTIIQLAGTGTSRIGEGLV